MGNNLGNYVTVASKIHESFVPPATYAMNDILSKRLRCSSEVFELGSLQVLLFQQLPSFRQPYRVALHTRETRNVFIVIVFLNAIHRKVSKGFSGSSVLQLT